MSLPHQDWILILDFGSQYTQLIARRIREHNVYCEIHPYNVTPDEFSERPPKGVVFSGGPNSVYDDGAPQLSEAWLEFDTPHLGICYGLQAIAHARKPGSVERAQKREFGRATLIQKIEDPLLKGLEDSTVWMSHGDHIIELPDGLEVIAQTDNAPVAAVRDLQKQVYGLQFHPEVAHTSSGKQILKNFVIDICGCSPSWTPASFIDHELDAIRSLVGKERVLCALSGGVDSTVVATLIHRAIGDQLTCVFVNNGLLRQNEYEDVLALYKNHLELPVEGVDASALFLERLSGVSDPEQKRKIIGKTFIDVFDDFVMRESSSSSSEPFRYLAQGTLYPDVIESVSFKGPSVTIKSHHNVGGLPEKMNLKLLEPVRELFKDEVRDVGRALDIPERFIARHPFPGPGLAIRLLGEISEERLSVLRKADAIFIEALREKGHYDEVWQALCVLLPVQSVGVMGDERTYENTVAIRAVTSVDGMTADWAHLPYDFLSEVSNRIINEVMGINRVVYDISSKPPATIEWE
ncbi:MAG TPA: GMP synthase (glutamine-hydrolyzing) [Bacteroidetes bacterium]|nr:MAG: glutamine-hydrolyzing GMP synthase [Rhodothermaceae bacterium TMED105]HBD42418.1 GMP synthase (glutamine-hydrolyzing) [Bacteroidota bacterium]|tara:strand:+ start:6646 stop:8211 length:1566 start_codon:yes stop_codon:yes gene_type:complete